MCYSQRRGLCCSAGCPVLLQGVSDHADSPRRKDRHIDRWHPVTHLRGQTHRKVIWWGWRSSQELQVEDLFYFLKHLMLFFSSFRFHQNRKGWLHPLKRQTWRSQQVRYFSHYCNANHISNLISRRNYFLCLPINRSSIAQTHDISNPNYMGVSFKSGSAIDKGWSYSMPPRTIPTVGQGGKDPKKAAYDLGTRSQTGKLST